MPSAAPPKLMLPPPSPSHPQAQWWHAHKWSPCCTLAACSPSTALIPWELHPAHRAVLDAPPRLQQAGASRAHPVSRSRQSPPALRSWSSAVARRSTALPVRNVLRRLCAPSGRLCQWAVMQHHQHCSNIRCSPLPLSPHTHTRTHAHTHSHTRTHMCIHQHIPVDMVLHHTAA
jgi:hypothetical protein